MGPTYLATEAQGRLGLGVVGQRLDFADAGTGAGPAPTGSSRGASEASGRPCSYRGLTANGMFAQAAPPLPS